MAHVRHRAPLGASGWTPWALGRTSVMAAALVTGLVNVVCAAPPAAGAAVPSAQSACTLLTHSQVALIIDGTRFNETISTPDHCSWDTPPEITSNGAQLEIQKVTPTNTLVARPSSEVRSGCGNYVIKHLEEPGITGYYCIYSAGNIRWATFRSGEQSPDLDPHKLRGTGRHRQGCRPYSGRRPCPQGAHGVAASP